MNVPEWAWLAFGAFVLAMLAIDLLAHRRAHVIGFREAAAIWSGVWVALGLSFGRVIWWASGRGRRASTWRVPDREELCPSTTSSSSP